MAITHINPEEMSAPFGVWTTAVMSEPGKHLYISGVTARNKQGEVVGKGDMPAQTRQICENLKTAVEAAGGSLKDIVNVTVYATDVTQFKTTHAVRKEYFPENPPASAMVEVTRLVDPECLIEISAVAAIGQSV
ncbi:RidA family protein [Aliamphritea hakodatensis]|uniref:RidA family protein n=1 Tax=Aliamphritea hakodatensis TaxID=2895352 RepID=UPI0022FD8EE2|nr:RidA family protein [Aliamphritea hakodatensis]